MASLNVLSPESTNDLRCRAKYTGFNVSAPGADTGITSGVKFTPSASVCRITIALTTSSVVNITCTDGSTTHKWGLNASAALNAADLYTFTFAVRANATGLAGGLDLTYDVEVETDSIIEILLLDEVVGAVI
jgi:hypothetical protein